MPGAAFALRLVASREKPPNARLAPPPEAPSSLMSLIKGRAKASGVVFLASPSPDPGKHPRLHPHPNCEMQLFLLINILDTN